MAIVEGVSEGGDVGGSAGLVKLVAAELLVELASRGVLEDEKDAGVVVKVAEQAQDVGVPEMGLDFDLPTELVLDPVFDELRLEEDFQTDDVLCLLLAGEIDGAELALPKRLADLEVVERP